MSAIRLRRTGKGVEVRVDDDSPQRPTPIWLRLNNDAVDLTCEEAEEVIAGLQTAVADARGIFGSMRERREANRSHPEITTTSIAGQAFWEEQAANHRRFGRPPSSVYTDRTGHDSGDEDARR